MLRDSLPSYQLPKLNDLSVPNNHEIEQILLFVDKHISGFPDYYQKNNESAMENWISNLLVRHFNLCNNETGGYLPYEFSKNPPQAQSNKETDIGVYINTRNSKPIPIIEFEAKRFSDSSSNEQYVYGDRGGIERFKRSQHSSHLKVCGMFGYVQSRTAKYWFTKVNGWLTSKSTKNTDSTIDWLKDEQLLKYASLSLVEKYSSSHTRKLLNDNIFLWHYFIDLTS